MLVKMIIILFLIVILYCLGSALFFLAREREGNEEDSIRVVKALAWRIGLSLVLFFLLFVAWALGWISPHSIGR